MPFACVACRTPPSGGGEADSRVVRAEGPQRNRVPSRRGEEEQPRAQADGPHISGGVAGISHLRARATIARVAGEGPTVGRRAPEGRQPRWTEDLDSRLDA